VFKEGAFGTKKTNTVTTVMSNKTLPALKMLLFKSKVKKSKAIPLHAM
jgi:hypothetical protein